MVNVLLNVSVTLKTIVAKTFGVSVCRTIPQTARYSAVLSVREVRWQRKGIVPKSLTASDATAGRITMNNMTALERTLKLALLKIP